VVVVVVAAVVHDSSPAVVEEDEVGVEEGPVPVVLEERVLHWYFHPYERPLLVKNEQTKVFSILPIALAQLFLRVPLSLQTLRGVQRYHRCA